MGRRRSVYGRSQDSCVCPTSEMVLRAGQQNPWRIANRYFRTVRRHTDGLPRTQLGEGGAARLCPLR